MTAYGLSTAVRFIEDRQLSAYQESSYEAPKITMAARAWLTSNMMVAPLLFSRGFKNKLFTMYANALAYSNYLKYPPPSRYEILGQYVSINNASRHIINTLLRSTIGSDDTLLGFKARLCKLRHSRILIATVPIAEANASAAGLPNDLTVLFFNFTLFPLLTVVSRLLVACLDMESEGGYLATRFNGSKFEALVENEDPVLIDAMSVLRAVLFGDSRTLEKIPHTGPFPRLEARVLSQLRSSALAFVICHELSHKLLGHLDETAQADVESIFELEEFSLEQNQELDADVLGFQMSVLLQKELLAWLHGDDETGLARMSVSHALWGQDFFLRAFWMLEGICYYLMRVRGTESRISSHPPYGDRLAVVREAAKLMVPKDERLIEWIGELHMEFFQRLGNLAALFLDHEGGGQRLSPHFVRAFNLAHSPI